MLLARSLGALAAVLGLLALALFAVRRFDLRLPGRVGGAARGRIMIVERASIDAKRSLLLIRQDGREHLLLLSPEGHLMLSDGNRTRAGSAVVHDILARLRAKAHQPQRATDSAPATTNVIRLVRRS